jgi:hypothetical protein
MKIYHVATTGYGGYITLPYNDLVTYVRNETLRARRYFGTAVCHTFKADNGNIYYTITARKDKRSALWVNITAHTH